MKFGLFQLLAVLTLVLPSQAKEPANAGKTVNTPWEFPKIATREEWERRAQDIREQIRISAGLWPMPEKMPLNAHIFDKSVHDGYSVEKVYFATWPGFYLAGNLYRPVGQGNGPFPAVINPHGHWEKGRLNDTELGSIPARCINFARQGIVAFSYDMVNYNDTHFYDTSNSARFYDAHSHFSHGNRTNLLWNISLMGLQTWNSIRALDFVESLPDVDKTRLGCTGASGGGTQTFILGAIDDRLAVQAPVNMVSHSMQGGCVCENMPGLRVKYSNMEIAAAAAPRPQLLVSATGDWTKTVPTLEGPAIENIYRLLGATEKLRYVQFDFPHNYNQTSREAVYGWFDEWLLHHPSAMSVKETPYERIPDEVLRVFPDGKLPDDAVAEDELVEELKTDARNRWHQLMPVYENWVENYRAIFLPAWRHTLQLDWPIEAGHYSVHPFTNGSSEILFDVPGKTNGISVVAFTPKSAPKKIVVLADSGDGSIYCSTNGQPGGLASLLLEQGEGVWVVRGFSDVTAGDPFAGFFTTYNRTVAQEHVRDLSILVASVPLISPGAGVVLCGAGSAAFWMLMAAPVADAVACDFKGADPSNDGSLLAPDVFCPGFQSIGGAQGMVVLAAPRPMLMHGLKQFCMLEPQGIYSVIGANVYRPEFRSLTDKEIAAWIDSTFKN